MLFERQRAVKCYSEIDWEAVVFQFLAIPLDVELIVSLVIVKVEGTHLGLGRVRIERVFLVVFEEGFQGMVNLLSMAMKLWDCVAKHRSSAYMK